MSNQLYDEDCQLAEEECVRTADYSVRSITHAQALDFIRQWHYAEDGANTGVYFHGLYRRGQEALLGVAWWLPPTPNAARSVSKDFRTVLGLTRLAVHPSVPKNGASLLLGRSIRMIRRDKKWNVLVTYADTAMGHTGAIYKATNWTYVGETRPSTVWIDGNGRQVSRKRGPKNLTARDLTAAGYTPRTSVKHKFVMVLRTQKTEEATP